MAKMKEADEMSDSVSGESESENDFADTESVSLTFMCIASYVWLRLFCRSCFVVLYSSHPNSFIRVYMYGCAKHILFKAKSGGAAIKEIWHSTFSIYQLGTETFKNLFRLSCF